MKRPKIPLPQLAAIDLVLALYRAKGRLERASRRITNPDDLIVIVRLEEWIQPILGPLLSIASDAVERDKDMQ